MRVVEVRERTIPISRYRDPRIPSGGLTTSLVAVITDVRRSGQPVVGYGFASVGRYGQGGLIRERFAPRLMAAGPGEIATADEVNLDPLRAWSVLMAGEKSGGHGERCVAVGALDMALWDAAAKIADRPLWMVLAERVGRQSLPGPVRAYASGGYPYPDDDLANLSNEIKRFVDLGFTDVKIKIGATSLERDLRRVDTATVQLDGPSHLAVDAMNRYDGETAPAAAAALAPRELRWFEDVCDPLDFATLARTGELYAPPLAAGEALFSAAEAQLLGLYGGLRPQRDVLVFDPVHCYGIPGYLRIIERLATFGWPRDAFWPHGGHLFALHVVSALGLGGCEINPASFYPFHGPPAALPVREGHVPLPDVPGIGFELHRDAWREFASLAG